MALRMYSFLSISLRVTPMMDLRQRISNTSSLRVSLDLRVHVSDANVAMGTIRALLALNSPLRMSATDRCVDHRAIYSVGRMPSTRVPYALIRP